MGVLVPRQHTGDPGSTADQAVVPSGGRTTAPALRRPRKLAGGIVRAPTLLLPPSADDTSFVSRRWPRVGGRIVVATVRRGDFWEPNKDLGASPLNSLQPPDRSPSLNDGFVGGEIPFSVAKS